MKCTKCNKIIKIPINILNIFLPKINDEYICKECHTSYHVPNWISWVMHIFYIPIFIISPFLLAHYIDNVLNSFYISLLIGFVIVLIIDYILASSIPIKEKKI